MRKRELGGLDYFKMAAAFLVVAIHTSPLASFQGNGDFVFTRVVARVAVPFFLMVTGYFMLPGYLFGKSEDFRPLFRYGKKVLLLYSAAILLYLPVNIYAGQFEGRKAGEILCMVAFDGTFYHLWYLPASVLGIWVVFLLNCLLRRAAPGKDNLKLRCRAVGAAVAFLYFAGLLGDSYYGLIEGVEAAKAVYGSLFRIFSYTRNGLFYAPVFLFMGAWMSCRKQRRGAAVNAAGFVLSLACMVAEGLTLHDMGVQRHDSMYIALLPCMYFLFRLLLMVKRKPAEHLRVVSTWIYLIHPLVIIAVRGGAKALHLESLLMDNSLVHYLAVCFLSCLFGVFLQRMFSRPVRKNDGKGRAWIEISRKNLRHNAETLQSLLPPDCRLLPVLKANAYGHGAALLAGELNAYGIKSFCVAAVSEGVELRKNGIRGEILILGYTHPEQFYLLRRYRLMQTVVDSSYAKLLNAYGKKIKVHIKIDTGMHRLGERCERTEEICRIFRCKNLVVKGVYTHLSADDTVTPADREFTESQGQALYGVVGQLEERGFCCGEVHLQASYGVLNYPELGGDCARIGIALYGMLSRREDEKEVNAGLRPILSVKARVAAVKDLYPGESAGYGFGYVAEGKRRIAVLAIGYADGVPRALSRGMGQVIIKGRKVSVIGDICMDQTIVDVTEAPDVKQGDVACLIGQADGCEITAYDWAERTGTIANEILSRMGGRLERVMV